MSTATSPSRTISEAFLSELDVEMPVTRRLLERVPGDKGAWKPHEKSFPLGHLAQLVARMPGWLTFTMRQTSIDLAAAQGYSLEKTETLLAEFDRNVKEAREALAKAGDADYMTPWSLKQGERVFFTLPRIAVMRQNVNHLVHHRGQLSVYLRPRGAFVQRVTHLRDGRDESHYDLGAWSLGDDGTLTLHGGRDDTRWAVKDARTLQRLDRSGQPIASSPPSEVIRSANAEPMEPRARLTGMFRYMADAARFRHCTSGLQWRVETGGDYRALERVYLARRAAPGAELMVSLQGRIEQRPKIEGDGSEPALVVEKFLDALPGRKCEERPPTAGLGNTRWRPIRIGDRTVSVPPGQREPWIVLEPGSKRVTGSGGCNRISGTYEAGAGALRFSPMISTQMACPAIETETAFLRALNATRRYRVEGRILELLDGDGKPLVRLEERNLQ